MKIGTIFAIVLLVASAFGQVNTRVNNITVLGTVTSPVINQVFSAGPGATPTIDQAVAACGLNPCTVVISPLYTGPESLNLVSVGGNLVYNGTGNAVIVDNRHGTTGGGGGGLNYPVIYGGRLAGQITQFGVNYYVNSLLASDSVSAITGITWWTGRFPSNNGTPTGMICGLVPFGAVDYTGSVGEFDACDSELEWRVTTLTGGPVLYVAGNNSSVNLDRTNAVGTINVASAYHARNNQNVSTSGGHFRFSYGFDGENQGNGTERNYAYHSSGNWLTENDTIFAAVNSSGTIIPAIFYRANNTIMLEPLSDTLGWTWTTQGGTTLFKINATNMVSNAPHLFVGSASPAADNGAFLGGLSLQWAGLYIHSGGNITVGGLDGLTRTVVVKGSSGANCDMVYTSGILTSTTCP